MFFLTASITSFHTFVCPSICLPSFKHLLEMTAKVSPFLWSPRRSADSKSVERTSTAPVCSDWIMTVSSGRCGAWYLAICTTEFWLEDSWWQIPISLFPNTGITCGFPDNHNPKVNGLINIPSLTKRNSYPQILLFNITKMSPKDSFLLSCNFRKVPSPVPEPPTPRAPLQNLCKK